MNIRRLLSLVSIGVIGCAPTAEIDSEETLENIAGVLPPQVAFDPTTGVIPIPNTLVLDPATDLINIPTNNCDDQITVALTTRFFNTLNGWPTNSPQIDIPLTAPVDVTSVATSVRIFNLVTGASVDFTAIASTNAVLDNECNGAGEAPILRLLPERLTEGQNYAVLIKRGLLAEGGAEFEASVFWALVRQSTNPVDIEFAADGDAVGTDPNVRFNVIRNETPFDPSETSDADALLGIDQLWNYHNASLAQDLPGFLPTVELLQAQTMDPVERGDIIHAFFFNTQESSATIDPMEGGSVSSTFQPAAPSLVAPFPAPAPDFVGGLLAQALGVTPGEICDFEAGDGLGAGLLPCFAVGKSQLFTFDSVDFLRRVNGVPTDFVDPYAPVAADTAELTGWYFEPNAALLGGAPADGWPVVIFGHGLGGDKSNAVGIVPQLNAAGLAVIAIDWPLHGTPDAQTRGRAVLNPCFQPDPPTTCGETAVLIPQCQVVGEGMAAVYPDFSEQRSDSNGNGFAEGGCYKQLLSLSSLDELTALRDRPRQGTFDVQQLIKVLEFCDEGTCDGGLGPTVDMNVDADRIGYLGQSLGGVLGALTISNTPEVRAAVLNVPGVSPVTTLSLSASFCPIVVDGLAAIGGVPPGSECANPVAESAFLQDPVYHAFAFAATWVLEPGDGWTFLPKLADGMGSAVLIQEVDGDTVVPNEATQLAGAALGLSPVAANRDTTPSPGVTAEKLLWLDYTSGSDADYSHGSLLIPSPGTPGAIGTLQMQTDAITFLVTNLAPAN